MVEIMAPVGSWESLRAAVKSGADSVYFGIGKLNMRAKVKNNFQVSDLTEIVKFCGKVKTYLTVNTVMYDEDLFYMREVCDAAKSSGIYCIIATDMAVVKYASSIGCRVNMSTQTNVSNIEAVKFFSSYADVMVLARELSLEQVSNICGGIKEQNIRGPAGELVKIEVFIHGALCVSISGKCYMSLMQYNCSANKGACIQPCRRRYRVTDEETGKELVLENKYVMSPKDLCTIEIIDQIVNSGVSILKIEGRGRAVDYVYKVVKVYREAVDSVSSGTFSKEKVKSWMKELESVYNRGFWKDGYYLGSEMGEWSGAYGSQATTVKEFVGVGKHYFDKKKVGHFLIETGEVHKGDKVLITGPTTGIIEVVVNELYVNGTSSEVAKKGDDLTFEVPEKIRVSDKLFVVKES